MANKPVPGGFGKFYFTTAIINSITTTVNGHLSRKHQEKMEAQRQALTIQMEHAKQDFQISQSERNAQLQRDLSMQNHMLRLEEQRISMENRCSEMEWNRFISTWPLRNLPMVLRNEQLLPDNTVTLRVLFAKSNNSIFQQAVYPLVEQGLREFVQIYHNQLQSRNLQFYHNAFNDNVSGGAAVKNIHFALSDLPTIVIDCNVLLKEIVVSLDMWGFGSDIPESMTVFRLPYMQKLNEKGQVITSYYEDIARQILARMKFVLGYAYDSYNLIAYNRPPLLPHAAELEKLQGAFGIMLDDQEVTVVLAEKYDEIYRKVIGSNEDSVAQLPESYKQTILHELRLSYAEATKDYISNAQYIRYLEESLDAWVSLRSTLGTTEFLESVLIGSLPVQKYFSGNDRDYFRQLKACYENAEADRTNIIADVCAVLASTELSCANAHALPQQILPAAPALSQQGIRPASTQSPHARPNAPKKRKFNL